MSLVFWVWCNLHPRAKPDPDCTRCKDADTINTRQEFVLMQGS